MPNQYALPSYEDIQVKFPIWTDTAAFFFLSAFMGVGSSMLNLMEMYSLGRMFGLLCACGFLWTVLTVPVNFTLRRQAYFSMLSNYSPAVIKTTMEQNSCSRETQEKLRDYLSHH